jgi:hypothetical protein
MKLKTLFATAILSGVTALTTAASASASDPGACAFNGRYSFGRAEYQCSLWRGNVPVYSGYSTSSSISGYLYRGGRANWFLSQCVGNPARLGGYANYWWAYTMADNGRWGYVPLTYFAGGADNQGSRVLPFTGGYTHLCGGGQTHPS